MTRFAYAMCCSEAAKTEEGLQGAGEGFVGRHARAKMERSTHWLGGKKSWIRECVPVYTGIPVLRNFYTS
jgi:hypothetical protein